MPTRELTTREDVTDLMQEGGPAALIDFWASWCGPCRALAPHFEEAARVLKDEPITFFKLDTENYPELAKAFNVRSLPTIIAVSDGKIQDSFVGIRDSQNLQRIAEKLINRNQKKGFFQKLFG